MCPVQVRLDRCCADEAWRDLFPNARVKHLTSSASDHCPLLLEVDALEPDKRRSSGSRYEIMWERHAALPDIIAKAWTKRSARNLGEVAANLKDVMKDLREWSKNHFGQVSKEIETLRAELEMLQINNADRSAIKEKMYMLDELLYREEMMWLQRSRIMWLKEGDQNTQYFHRKAVWRARKNLNRRLRKDDGSIGPIKAPGPDGFPARFFQRNWEVLKEDITAAVLEFFSTGYMPPGVNDTAIALIPKVSSPSDLKDFRPISLYNVVYKVVSKCLVNHLRPLLTDLIFENQSVFIPGRLISDNTIIAFECIHHIQTSRQENSYCVYKLDLSKAYDRVD